MVRSKEDYPIKEVLLPICLRYIDKYTLFREIELTKGMESLLSA